MRDDVARSTLSKLRLQTPGSHTFKVVVSVMTSMELRCGGEGQARRPGSRLAASPVGRGMRMRLLHKKGKAEGRGTWSLSTPPPPDITPFPLRLLVLHHPPPPTVTNDQRHPFTLWQCCCHPQCPCAPCFHCIYCPRSTGGRLTLVQDARLWSSCSLQHQDESNTASHLLQQLPTQ